MEMGNSNSVSSSFHSQSQPQQSRPLTVCCHPPNNHHNNNHSNNYDDDDNDNDNGAASVSSHIQNAILDVVVVAVHEDHFSNHHQNHNNNNNNSENDENDENENDHSIQQQQQHATATATATATVSEEERNHNKTTASTNHWRRFRHHRISLFMKEFQQYVQQRMEAWLIFQQRFFFVVNTDNSNNSNNNCTIPTQSPQQQSPPRQPATRTTARTTKNTGAGRNCHNTTNTTKSSNNNRNNNRTNTAGVVVLRRCRTISEQQSYITSLLQTCQSLRGTEGLSAMGLEYRTIPCDEHKEQQQQQQQQLADNDISATTLRSFNTNTNEIDDDDAADDDNDDDTTYMANDERVAAAVAAANEDHDSEEIGQASFMELAKVNTLEFGLLSKRTITTTSNGKNMPRSDSIISQFEFDEEDDTDTGYHDATAASHNADIGTTPSLAASTALPYMDDDDDGGDGCFLDDDDRLIHDGIKRPSAITTTTTTATILPNDQNTTTATTTTTTTTNSTDPPLYKNPNKQIVHQFCHLCERKLYDRATNTCITDRNRHDYIAAGEMYELTTRLVQEYAHEIMMQEGNLTWINIDNEDTYNNNATATATTTTVNNGTTQQRQQQQHREPIRILISKKHPCLATNRTNANDHDDNSCTQQQCTDNNNNQQQHHQRPTVLICTGRGKVRAGIFSRHHLLCTGLERSTAIPYIHEAIHRNIHVAIMDPNVHGEAHGFTTFTKTMDYLQSFYNNHKSNRTTPERNVQMTTNPISTTTSTTGSSSSSIESIIFDTPDCCRDMYILSHSASGGHFVRYFLDKSQTPYLQNIRAIAFTDSTHNIQWTKGDHQTYLFELLQSLYCIYFRCSSSTRDTIAGDGDRKWYLHPAGEIVQHTDSFWRHRFGTIRTVWAGTNEHSQTNWYAHAKVWEHFDQFLFASTP